MSVDLYLDEKMFISVKRASKETGYSQDYIGQLSRKGKIPAKLVGRSWFVNIDSLLNHKDSVEGRIQRKNSVVSNKVENNTDLGMKSTYLTEPDLPKLVEKSNAKNFLNIRTDKYLIGSAALVAAFAFVGGAYSWLSYLNPNLITKIDSGIVAYYESTVSFVSEAKLAFGRFNLAQVRSSQSGDSVSQEGLVVIPESVDQQERVDLVKQNFSDDVEVYFDEDNQSGVIRPVFKSAAVPEDYAFVMVPIKTKK